MSNLNKLIIFYPSFENGGATKNLQNLVKFFTFKNIKVELISGNANYSNFDYKKNYFRIFKPKKILSYFYFQRVNYSVSVLQTFLKKIKNINKKNTLVLSMQSHLLSVIISKVFGVKIVIRNSEDPLAATKYADERILSILVFISKFLSFNLADGIITNSTKSFLNIKFFLLNKKKISVIFNPYLKSVNKIKSKKKPKNIILAIGRFTKQKNFLFLIEAFKEFHNLFNSYKLIIIGSGKGKNDLIAKINELKIDKNVELLSWQKNLKKYFIKSKFFVMPSLYEGLPNILIDTINMGVPCISSNCSGAKDILNRNKAGLIYDINNKRQIIHKMRLIHNNFGYYKNNSIKFMPNAKKFLIGPQSLKYLDFINKIL